MYSDALPLQRLYHWARTVPQRVAFTQPFTGAGAGTGPVVDLTWAQVLDHTRRMAAYLQAQGIGPGDRVAILSKNCVWWMLTDYAIWMAGAVSVPLYPTLAPDTVRQILTHSGAKLLFVGKLDDWAMMQPGVPAGLPCVSYPLSPPNDFPTWDDIIARTAPMQGEPVRGADELATLMYTSGTTGAPKGVMHSFGRFMWAVQAGLKRIPMDSEDRMLSYLPLSHVVERALVEHAQLARGFRVFFAESLDTFTTDLQRARPTVFFSVPRLWLKFQQGVHAKMPPAKLERLLKLPIIGGLVRRKVLKALGLDQCRLAAGGAAPMPVALLQFYARLGLTMFEGYGMTENVALSHATLPGKPRPGTVGLPYDGVESRLDPTSGEVQMRSPALMLGYYREEQLTRDAFTEDGWLRTGDKGALDAEGNLRITGRVKDLFKTSKGKYVAPAPIEDKLTMHGAVEACCVTGANLAQPVGIVQLNPAAVAQAAAGGRAELEASLGAHLAAVNATLDPHEQLDCLVLDTEPWTVHNGLVTPTLKVKRNRVDEVYEPRLAGWLKQRKPVVWAAG